MDEFGKILLFCCCQYGIFQDQKTKNVSLLIAYETKGKPFECDMAVISIHTFHLRKISPRCVSYFMPRGLCENFGFGNFFSVPRFFILRLSLSLSLHQFRLCQLQFSDAAQLFCGRIMRQSVKHIDGA